MDLADRARVCEDEGDCDKDYEYVRSNERLLLVADTTTLV